jgi:hypothetical protein
MAPSAERVLSKADRDSSLSSGLAAATDFEKCAGVMITSTCECRNSLMSPRFISNYYPLWASLASEVDRLAEVVRQAGARNIEGPMQYERGYYAVFFEDPSGNRLEVCYRTHGTES